MGSVRATLAVLSLMTAPALAAETPVAAGANPEITVYADDLALVHDRRTFRLTTPETRFAFAGVSARLKPETAFLSVVSNPQVKAADVKLLDQTFAFHVISQQSLLEQSVGQDVSVVSTNPATGRDVSDRAKVVSVRDGLVLDMGGKIYTGAPGRLVFDGLPENLRPAPALLVTAAGPVGKDITADLSYLTNGLDWHADYVAHYDGEGDRLDLTAWAMVTNATGVDFKDAKLKLAAGEVNRVKAPPSPMPMRAMMMRADVPAAAAEAAPSAPNAPSQALDTVRLYTIARPTTLANGESKQLLLLQVNNLAVKHEYIVRGQPWYYTAPLPTHTEQGGAEIEVTVKNEPRSEGKSVKGKETKESRDGSLGMALPAGVVRAYGDDDGGATQFLGEDKVDAVVPGGDMHLHLGRDAELPVTREQLSIVHATDTISISAWRLSFKNAKSKPVTVRVEEPVSGAWEIPKETVAHTKNAAGLPEWSVTVPARGDVVLEYSIKTSL